MFRGDLAQQGIARAPLDQRHESTLSFTAHHPVDCPVTDPAFFLNDRRSLIDTGLVFNLPAGIGFAIPFLTFLLTVSQMAIQRTAGLSIRTNMLINALRTQPKTALGRQPTRNLLRTPFLAQIRFDPFDYLRRHLGHLRLLLTPRQGVLVGLAGTVAALATIAAQFPADRRGRHRQRRRDGLLIMPDFLQGVDLVSLTLGQLVILAHKRLRRELRLKWTREIYQLTFSKPATSAIALTC